VSSSWCVDGLFSTHESDLSKLLHLCICCLSDISPFFSRYSHQIAAIHNGFQRSGAVGGVISTHQDGLHSSMCKCLRSCGTAAAVSGVPYTFTFLYAFQQSYNLRHASPSARVGDVLGVPTILTPPMRAISATCFAFRAALGTNPILPVFL
jgi:hypothetical protein